MIHIYAFYHFVFIEQCDEMKKTLLSKATELGIKGIILIAHEGVNATISGTTEALEIFLGLLKGTLNLPQIDYKVSHHNQHPFHRLKVKVKDEIITFKQPDIQPHKNVGQYLNTQEWNELIKDPETIVVDTRNDYEYQIGTFHNAINPKTKKFSEFADFVDNNLKEFKGKKIATFCTGGIRCEKATSFLINKGFESVYHLKGGILKYLEEVDDSQNLWKGECFVFDQRVSVKEKVEVAQSILCHGCRTPLTTDDLQSTEYEEGVSCHHCFHQLTIKKIKRRRDRQKQIMLCKQRNKSHFGSQ